MYLERSKSCWVNQRSQCISLLLICRVCRTPEKECDFDHVNPKVRFSLKSCWFLTATENEDCSTAVPSQLSAPTSKYLLEWLARRIHTVLPEKLLSKFTITAMYWCEVNCTLHTAVAKIHHVASRSSIFSCFIWLHFVLSFGEKLIYLESWPQVVHSMWLRQIRVLVEVQTIQLLCLP